MEQDLLSMLGKEEPQEKPMKEDTGTAQMDDDLLGSMLTADGKDGNFQEPEKKKKKGEDSDEPSVKISSGKVEEQLDKYSDEFMKNVMDHPDKFSVQTSRGRMTIKDAIMKGWNPSTGEFDDTGSIEKMKEDELGKLNESDRAAVEDLMNPSNAGIAAADAEAMGVDPNSPMVAGAPPILGGAPQGQQSPLMGMEGMPPQGEGGAEAPIDPAILQKMMGGKI